MGKAVFTFGVVLYLLSSAWSSAQNGTAPKQLQPVSAAPVIASAISAPTIIPLDQIHEGMKGTALTVFQGVKPESMEVEVLGVMRNVNGPKGDIILVRLHGEKVEYTGVVAGMSGSPVYLDGKLAGALAFRIGEFSKEPIAGVTPIADMLEINALDRSPAEEAAARPSVNGVVDNIAGKTASPGDGPRRPGSEATQGFANYLKPIETPLVFNGFSEDTVHRFASQFASAGIVPVMGAGSVSDAKQPEPQSGQADDHPAHRGQRWPRRQHCEHRCKEEACPDVGRRPGSVQDQHETQPPRNRPVGTRRASHHRPSSLLAWPPPSVRRPGKWRNYLRGSG